MKVGIYTPYLDSFGGGERYMLTIAEALSSQNEVDLLIDQHLAVFDINKLKDDLAKRFNLNLQNVSMIKGPIGQGSHFLNRLFFLKKYDLFFYLTDGSIFYSTAKKNIIHFQVPFKNVGANGLFGRLKLSSWNKAIFNSNFTKDHIERDWGIKGQVVYPPVDVDKIKPLHKKKYILSVGRFASFSKSKRHDEMIEVFGDILSQSKMTGWSLHLAGSVEGDKGYLNVLKGKSVNLPVFFYPDCAFSTLVTLYGESSIYWHAAGMDETDPTKMEHFGITTVEAMSGGCVPVVINKGGLIEIVENNHSGLLWNSTYEFKNLTIKLMKDSSLMSKLSKNAALKAKKFSKSAFVKKIKEISNER